MKSVYLIRFHDPRSTEYHPEGRDDFCWGKGVFTSREVAEFARGGMEMFQEVGDETTYRVIELKFNPEDTVSEWLDNNLPGRKTG